MKKRKWFFYGVISLMLLAALYSGEKIFYMSFGLLISVILFALLSNLLVLWDFHYLQTVTPSKTIKGGNTILLIQIHNDKPFIFSRIKLHYQTPASVLMGTTEEHFMSILPFSHNELKREFDCALRGQYPLGMTRIEVGDIFGLFTLSMDLTRKPYHNMALLTVLPRIIKLHNLPLPQIRQEGTFHNQLFRTEEAATLSDIRQYRFGDPLKKIHWKLSSKTQEIQVMDQEMTVQPHTYLFIETTPCKHNNLINLQIEDQMIECATAIIHYILEKTLPIKLIIYDIQRIELNGRNAHDFSTLYEYLSSVTFESHFPIKDIIQMESAAFSQQGSIMLVIHQLDHVLFNYLCILNHINVHPMVLLIQHRASMNEETKKMIGELNSKGIPSVIIFTDQRLDECLEAL